MTELNKALSIHMKIMKIDIQDMNPILKNVEVVDCTC